MNKVIMDGYVANDPKVDITQSGKKRASFNVAQRLSQDKTQFVRVQCWDKTAEYAENYCKKGEFVVGEGRLSVYESTDMSGRKSSVIQVIIDRLERVNTHRGQQQSTYKPAYQPTYQEPIQPQVEISDADLPF